MTKSHTMMSMRTYIVSILALSVFCLGTTLPAFSQEDEDFEDFDPSMFEEAGDVLQPFCTNKVIGQTPTSLISLGYDVQGPSTLTAGAVEGFAEESVDFSSSQGFRFVTNVPVLSRNNLLINLNVNYIQLGFQRSNDDALSHPLSANLDTYDLKWFNTNFTIFKPLNEKRFVLVQVGAELNGDYTFGNLPSFANTRFPIAAMYGFKPSDNLMWAIGASRTYLGGSLNYLPVVYYYQTFKNEKWGVEALFPARAQLRYRANSRNVLSAGYTVEGATYRLDQFNSFGGETINEGNNIELRRSEIRLGLSYLVGLSDFLYIGAQAGYRINYSYDVDQGDFYRGFNGDGFLILNGLTNTPYAQVTLSMVSP